MKRRERSVLLASVLASSLVGLNVSMVPVALPDIRQSLGATLSEQLWVGSAFLLALGALLIFGGSLGDRVGRYRVFGGGVFAFGVCSMVCALAQTITALLIGRALQGVAAALFVPAILAVLTDTFRGEARGRALGTWLAWTSVTAVASPPLAGLLVGTASWRLPFLFEMPLALVTAFVVWRAAPPQPLNRSSGKLDPLGALLGSVAVGGPIYALLEGPSRGWVNLGVLGPLGLGLAALAGFILWERRTPSPMLPLSLFKRRAFRVLNLTTFTLYASYGAAGYFITLFVQQVGGYSPLAAGFALAPVFVILSMLAPFAGPVVRRLGPRLSISLGATLGGVSHLLEMRLDAEAAYVPVLLPALCLAGLGLVLVVAPLTDAVLASADDAYTGVASGLNNALARVAGVMGLAVVGAVISASFAVELNSELELNSLNLHTQALVAESREQALTTGPTGLGARAGMIRDAFTMASVTAFRYGLAVCAALAFLAAAICLFGLSSASRGTDLDAAPT